MSDVERFFYTKDLQKYGKSLEWSRRLYKKIKCFKNVFVGLEYSRRGITF